MCKAGLFSASLTTFIIESYKTLILDFSDSTIQLLAQISQQLAAAANGSHFQIPEPTQFTPPTSSLVCNTLWFVSLGLSLTCAHIAMLLEQWARDFLHRLKRFGMHTVVDIIPLLLHGSLFLFFAGLVTFLLPINLRIVALAATVLVAVVVVYVLLTLFPLLYLDCPYHTPLSAASWHISQTCMSMWRRWHTTGESDSDALKSSNETIVEAMSNEATAECPTRTAREYRALVSTEALLSDTRHAAGALAEVASGPGWECIYADT
ncbi:hypothetical protein B0H10DRAFT_2221666 [Mycena sp. CBHHK59/15]|nr:hypothetical protein B0H10DRAFT_2221666 [Mycena sp. CBHHK59/15]